MHEIVGNQQHGIASVADTFTYLPRCLASAAINDGNEIIGDDDSVFARFLTFLADKAFLDDGHSLILR